MYSSSPLLNKLIVLLPLGFVASWELIRIIFLKRKSYHVKIRENLSMAPLEGSFNLMVGGRSGPGQTGLGVPIVSVVRD